MMRNILIFISKKLASFQHSSSAYQEKDFFGYLSFSSVSIDKSMREENVCEGRVDVNHFGRNLSTTMTFLNKMIVEL